MDIKSGDIVRSLAGRDEGRLFVVMAVEGEYLYLTDGRLRRVEKPKKKKKKHVRFEARAELKVANRIRDGEKFNSSDIRKGLAEFLQESRK